MVCAMCSVVSDSLWPYGLQPARLLCLWNFPGKNTGVGYHFLLPIFLTQGMNLCLLCLLHCRWILYPLSHRGKLNRKNTMDLNRNAFSHRKIKVLLGLVSPEVYSPWVADNHPLTMPYIAFSWHECALGVSTSYENISTTRLVSHS